MNNWQRDCQPTVGVIGFGAFGRLMARHLAPFFPIKAYDPRLTPGEASSSGVEIVGLPQAAACQIVILSLPVDLLGQAIAEIGPYLSQGALVMDVASVKVGPSAVMLAGLPAHVEVIGTHPLFGPQSAANGIAGLKIAICPIRSPRSRRVAAFLRRALGLKVYITTPEDHDREAATVQGLTHLIAKVLVRLEPLPTRMTTASFDMLMRGGRHGASRRARGLSGDRACQPLLGGSAQPLLRLRQRSAARAGSRPLRPPEA